MCVFVSVISVDNICLSAVLLHLEHKLTLQLKDLIPVERETTACIYVMWTTRICGMK